MRPGITVGIGAGLAEDPRPEEIGVIDCVLLTQTGVTPGEINAASGHGTAFEIAWKSIASTRLPDWGHPNGGEAGIRR